jgi:hypothetical protein
MVMADKKENARANAKANARVKAMQMQRRCAGRECCGAKP